MKQSTLRTAIGLGEIDDSFIEQEMCPICPWTTGKIPRPRIGECEGVWCEETYETAMIEVGAFE